MYISTHITAPYLARVLENSNDQKSTAYAYIGKLVKQVDEIPSG